MSDLKPWLVALDMDRTLTREPEVTALLVDASLAVGIDPKGWQTAQAETEAEGGSFSTLAFLRRQHSQEQLDKLRAFYIEHATPALLYRDVLPLLGALKERGIPTLILTYGENDWQHLKLEAAGLVEYEYIITDYQHKGKLISQWRHESGYRPPEWSSTESTQHVLLVDDKALSFEGLPKDCRGALIRRPGERLLISQRGEVPKQVTTVNGLADCLALIAS